MSVQKETSVLELVINGKQAETSINGLTNSIRATEREFKKMRQADDPKAYAEAAKNIRLQRSALAEMQQEMRGVNREAENLKTNWKDIAKGVLAAGFIDQGIGMLKAFGAEMVATYTQFEKYGAVLENALGNKSAARRAMADLQQFAKETPFALTELMDSYVKLTNRGMQPTLETMRKMGDLAASQGKSFDQLTEAVLDAATGEFERLKEFGIRASKNGKLVELSFKGITQEVDFTSEAITKAIEGFGQMEGVQDSMIKTSETLGGRIDNMGDSWDQLLVAMGANTAGVIYNSVSIISEYLEWITEAVKSTETRIQENTDRVVGQNLASIQKRSAQEQKEIIEGTKLYIKDLEEQEAQLEKNIAGTRSTAAKAQFQAEKDKLKQLIDIEKGTVEAYDDTEKTKLENKKKADDELKRQEAKTQRELSEKKAKADEKKAEQERKRREKEIENLKETLSKELNALDISGMDALDQIVANILAKYDPLIKKAKELGQVQLVKDLTQLRDMTVDRDTTAYTNKQKKEDADFAKSEEKKQYDSSLTINTSFYEEQKLATAQLYEAELITKKEYDAKLLELEKLKLRDEIEINTLFGIDSTEQIRQLTDFNISEKERETLKVQEFEQQKKQFMIDAAQQGADAIFSIMAGNRQAQLEATLSNIDKQREEELSRQNLSERQKKAINDKYDKQIAEEKLKAFKREQLASVAQAVINGALAITMATSQTGILAPFVIPTIIASTAAQVAVIAAQKPPKFSDGGVPAGPSHAQGGIKMVDGITGAVIGEMEGGEPIISKEKYAANKQTIDEIMFGNARSKTYNIASTDLVNNAERFYRNGGIAPSVSKTSGSEYSKNTTTTESSRLDRLEQSLDKLIGVVSAESAKQVIFSQRTFEEESARRIQIKNDAGS